jgi:acyl-CoA synthetase (AMP-forming)/AMP-acid ligase II
MLYIDFFDRGVAYFPDRTLVRDAERSISYREMHKLVGRIATALIRDGISPGDHVATWSRNSAIALACKYGAIRAGAVWVPVNARYTAHEAATHIGAFDVDFLFADSYLSDTVTIATEGNARLKGVVSTNDEFGIFPDLEAWLGDIVSAEGQVFPERMATDPVVMLTTSGTTGEPKGVLLSNRSIATMIASHQLTVPMNGAPVHLVVAPMTHAAGVFASSLLSVGGTNVLLAEADPLSILQAIEREKADIIFLPPTLIYMMLAHAEVRTFDYTSLQCMLYGAAPMSVQKLREAIDVFGPVLAQGYGQSEVPNTISFFSPADHVAAVENPDLQHRISSAGRPGPLCKVEIMDEEGKILPPGERGEIVCRGDLVMNGYYNRPEETQAVSQFGWHHTGDIGVKDADGFLYLVDRKKDMIISGGFNVFPGEVEQSLLSHPAVQDCAVVGIPDEKWGEAVLGAVQLKPGQKVDAAELIAHCKAELGSIKAPKSIDFWDDLPRSPVGKTLRRAVRAKYWANQERAI